MPTIKYLIRLKPLTPFFFGGENTFGEDNPDYFVRSNYLPQQTTLLGFLRYELLLQNNLIGTDPEAANWEKLIGKSSFHFGDTSFASSFGAIHQLSPLFLSDGENHYIPQAFDWGLASVTDNGQEQAKLFPLHYSLLEGESILVKSLNKIPALKAGNKPFKQKNGIKSLWVSADGRFMKQWDYEKEFAEGRGFSNGFFIAHQQAGIQRKTRRTKDNTGDFYRLVKYNLADDFAFAFFADLRLPDEKTFDSRIVTMGGERSLFQMTVSSAGQGFEDVFTKTTFAAGHAEERAALVLTSDAYSESPVLDHCDFAITETVPFRSIRSVQQGKGDYVRIKGGALTKAGQLLYLLKRGSVFYGNDLSGLKQALDNPAFRTVGYNYFIEL